MERRCAKEAKGQQGAHDSLVTENDRLNREVCLLREASKVRCFLGDRNLPTYLVRVCVFSRVAVWLLSTPLPP